MSTETPQFTVIPLPEIQRKKELLEAVFDRINKERMADVPITNDDINVSAIGFQQWQNSLLGILVTPWFMNLMLLPGEAENWQELNDLSKQTHYFPSGKYTFITGYEADIGKYQMCSLFSPMFDFADNAAAVETAEVAIKELMNDENIEQIDLEAEQIEDIWNGETTLAQEDLELTATSTQTNASDDEDEQETGPSISEKMEKPISRRKMLRNVLPLTLEDNNDG